MYAKRFACRDTFKQVVLIAIEQDLAKGLKPSMSRIARRLGVSYNGVIDIRKALEREGRVVLPEDDDPMAIVEDDPAEVIEIEARLKAVHEAKLRRFNVVRRWQGLPQDELQRVLP